MELKNADNLHNFKQVQSVSEDVLKPGRFGFSVNVKCHAFLKISRSFLTESVKEDDISLGLK